MKRARAPLDTDQEARRRAVREVDTSLALSAGAGSGKTSVLVDRALTVLERGTPPERLAVITFTEAAALEARARLLDRVAERLTGGVPPGLEPLDPAARRRIERLDPSELRVTTIHALALRLLRAESFEGGFLPSAGVEDAVATASGISALREGWWPSLADRQLAPALEARARCSSDALDRGLAALLVHRDLGYAVDDRYDLEGLDASLAALRHAMEACLRPDGCTLYAKASQLLEAGQGCADALRSGRELPAELPTGRLGRAGRAADWPNGAKERVLAVAAELGALLRRASQVEAARLHRFMVEAAERSFVPYVRAVRREAGKASFDDLLHEACVLLEQRPRARRRARASFDQIMVDEMQDTDPLQARIVSLLTRTREGDEPWTEADLARGRVFVVGDPKQSIYRFRRADVRTFDRMKGRIGEEATLRRSFRSVPEIVDFVNFAFKYLVGDQPLVPTRSSLAGFDEAVDPLVILRTDADGEAEAIARHLRDLLDRRTEVHDRELGGRRPVEPRDVMVLLPSWTKADSVEDALVRAGVPAFVDGGRTFFDRDEVRLARGVLRALADPGDAEAVVAVLRGGFGASFDELAEHRAAGGHWRYTLPSERSGAVARALRLLESARRPHLVGRLVPALDAVLEAGGAPLAWRLTARAEGIAANLDKVRELVRRLEQEGLAPEQVVDRIERLARESDGEQDLPLRPFEGSAVEVTSVFKAKGRERAVVVLCAMQRSRRTNTALVSGCGTEVAVGFGDLRPLDWDERAAAERAELDEERERMMYVAATRARDQLVLCWSDDRAGSTELLQNVARVLPPLREVAHDALAPLPGAPELAVRVRDPETLPELPGEDLAFGALTAAVDAALAADGPRGSEPGGADAFDGWSRERIAAARRSTPRWRSVREVAQARLRRRGVLPDRRKTGDGPDVGKAVHRALEELDLGMSEAELRTEGDASIRVEAVRQGLSPQQEQRAQEILHDIIGHRLLEEIRRAGTEVWQEVPFAHPGIGSSNTVVNGVIDLCFPLDPERTRWKVVDWKTDRPAPGSPNEQAYQEQLRLYAEALVVTRVAPGHQAIETELVGQVDPPPVVEDGLAQGLLDALPAGLRAAVEASIEAGGPEPYLFEEVPGTEVIPEVHYPEARVAAMAEATEDDREAVSRAGFTLYDANDPDDVARLFGRLARPVED